MPASSLLVPADPKANYLAHKDEIDQAIHRVLDSGRYILGREVAGFEEEFAAYLGVRYAIGVASGTEALEVALRSCGIGFGDAVITVSHTAVATVAAVELAGATPVLVDIDPGTFTMDPNRLENAIRQHSGDRLKAVIPVHLYGHPADMPAIMDIARRHELTVIEDCAQSHGATIEGQKTGTWGHLSAFSFYPTKNLGALGDGGAVVTNDPILADRLRLLREYGCRERYVSDLPGMNTRLDELQAAILRVKLQYLNKENAHRQEIARLYSALLSSTALVVPESRADVDHVYHLYVIRCKRRDDLRAFLKEHSVSTFIHYPVPVHLQPAYRGRVVIGRGGLHHTEHICREILSLPLHPQIASEQVQRISHLIARWNAHMAEAS